MSTDQGYVLLHRRYWRHPLFKPAVCTPLEAWVWLNMNAMHTPGDVSVTNGRHRSTVRLQAGQLAGSVRFLADKWQWSDKRVQRFLTVLKRDQLVTTETTTGQTVITLCNWGEDQRPFAAATTQTATQSTTQTTTKKKELKELKKNTLSDEGFDLFWKAFPRQVARQAAKKAYVTVIAAGLISESDLLAKTKAFAASWAVRLERKPTDEQFIPHPATWLNGGRYNELDAKATEPLSADKLTDAQWLLYLEFSLHNWPKELGAKPGMPGYAILNVRASSVSAAGRPCGYVG
jgi:DNA-binding transcriptional regulator YhcF (GntR family)